MSPSPEALLVILVILGVSHWIGCIAAFGSALLAMPALVWLMDLPSAVFVVLVVGLPQSAMVVWDAWHAVDWRRLWLMLAVAGLGMPLGFAAVEYLPRGLLVTALGLLSMASGISRLRAGAADHTNPWPTWALRLLLFAGGVLHGAFSCGGATIAVYAQHSFANKQAFRGTLSLFWGILGSAVLACVLYWRETPRTAQLTMLWGLPVVLLATWSANRFTRRLSQAQFARYVAWLLVLAGVVAVARAFH